MSLSRIKTASGHQFHGTGWVDKNQCLFSVTPGLPLGDVLESISNLLDTLEDPIHEAAMGERPLQDNHAWLVLHTLHSAKAALDALADGLDQVILPNPHSEPLADTTEA